MKLTEAQLPVQFLCEVADMIQPLASDPPCQHWLCSDATFSYCWPCARLARWFELDRMGPPPPASDWYERTEVEEEIIEGIDGGDWYSGESDTPQYCEMCGCLLRFSLTASGVDYTYEGFDPPSIGPEVFDNPDAIYELHEMLSQGAWVREAALVDALIKTATVVKALAADRAGITETGRKALALAEGEGK